MGGDSEQLKYCKRIGLLYLCWLIIDFWYVWTNKTYFHVGIGEGIIEFIKDLFFASTFPGSWYLSASVMGGIWVYILNKIFHPVITFVVSYLLACYISRVNMLPDSFQVAYEWYAMTFRKEVILSFPGQMVWIPAGQLLSLVMKDLWSRKRLLPVSVFVFIASLIINFFVNIIELKIIMAISIVIACLLIDLPSSSIYKRLRSYSILMFFFHFSIAGKMRYFTAIVGDSLLTNWLYYLIVVTMSVLFAEMVLRLEKQNTLLF